MSKPYDRSELDNIDVDKIGKREVNRLMRLLSLRRAKGHKLDAVELDVLKKCVKRNVGDQPKVGIERVRLETAHKVQPKTRRKITPKTIRKVQPKTFRKV